MTCIVGVVHEGRVHMGADSRIFYEDSTALGRYDHKAWQMAPYMIGVAGSARICQLLRSLLTLPRPPGGKKDDLFSFVMAVMPPEIRRCIVESGAAKAEDTEWNVEMLVGVRGHLFTVDSDLTVLEHPQYTAIGSGTPYALGSLRRTEKQTPRIRIQRALTDAAEFCASVGPPYHFMVEEQ